MSSDFFTRLYFGVTSVIERSFTVLPQVQYLRRRDVWLQNSPQLTDSRCDISKNEYIPTEGTVFLEYDTASLNDWCPTFRECLLVSSSRVNVRRKLALVKGSPHFAKNLFVVDIRGCRRAPFDVHKTLQCPLLMCW